VSTAVSSSVTYWRQIDRGMGITDLAIVDGAVSTRTRVSDDCAQDQGVGPVPLRLLPERARVLLGDSLSIGGVEVAAVAGKHCESGDLLIKKGHLPQDVVVGDGREPVGPGCRRTCPVPLSAVSDHRSRHQSGNWRNK
jgi:diaminopimelate decarboxylase